MSELRLMHFTLIWTAVVKEGAALRAVSGSSLADPSDGNLPVRKGYLEKWTNMAK